MLLYATIESPLFQIKKPRPGITNNFALGRTQSAFERLTPIIYVEKLPGVSNVENDRQSGRYMSPCKRKLLRVTLGTIDPVYLCQKEILSGVSNDENDRQSGKIFHLANRNFEIYNEALSGPTRSRADCTEKGCIAGLSKKLQ